MKYIVIFAFLVFISYIMPPSLDAKTEESLHIEKTLLKEDVTILQKVQSIYLVERNDTYYLEEDTTPLYQFPIKLLDMKLFLEDNKIYVFGLDNQCLVAYVFLSDGTLLIHQRLLDFPIYHGYQVQIEESIVIFGTALSEEALMSQLVIQKRPQGKLEVFVAHCGLDLSPMSLSFYGGSGDELFLKATKANDIWWVVFQKDQISSGDFGNAGAYAEKNLGIFQLDIENRLIDYIVFQEQVKQFVDLIYLNEYYLIYNDTILVLREDFTQIKRVLVEDIIEIAVLSPSDTFFILTKQNKVIVLDKRLFEKQYTYLENTSVDKVVRLTDALLYQDNDDVYQFDILYLENQEDTSCSVSYCVDYDFKTKYTTPFETGVAVSDDSFLKRNTHGIYLLQEFVELQSGYKLELEKTLTVLPERNITEGRVYPYGYKVLFSGRVWINDKEIIQNDSLLEVGVNVVRVMGENTEEIFEIRVDLNQIKFEEDLIRFWDYTVEYDSKRVYFDIFLDSVLGIYANERYYPIHKDSLGKTFIELNSVQEPGVFLFRFQGFLLNDAEDTFVPENKTMLLRILKPFPLVGVQIQKEEEMSILLDIIDNYGTIRGLYIENDATEQSKQMIIEDHLEVSWTVEEGLYGVNSVYLVIDIGDKKQTFIPLYQVEVKHPVQSIYFGNLNVLQKTQNFEMLEIQFDASHLEQFDRITVGTEEVLISKKNESNFLLIGSIIFFGVGFSTFFLLSLKKKQQGV